MRAHNQNFGRFGEDAAARWYQASGYRILDRNWRCEQGEIDLVALGHEVVVFAEVKARSTTRYGSGFDAVDRRKQARVRRLARLWLAEHRGPGVVGDGGGDPAEAGLSGFFADIRFDVVDVDANGTVQVKSGCF